MKQKDLKIGDVVEYRSGKYSQGLRAIYIGPSRPHWRSKTPTADLAIEASQYDYFETEAEARAFAATLTGATVEYADRRVGPVWEVRWREWAPYLRIPFGHLRQRWADKEAADHAAAEARVVQEAEWAKKRAETEARVAKRQRFVAGIEAQKNAATKAAWAGVEAVSARSLHGVKVEVSLKGRPAEVGDFVTFKLKESRDGAWVDKGHILRTDRGCFTIESPYGVETVERDAVYDVVVVPQYAIVGLTGDALAVLLTGTLSDAPVGP